VLAASEATSNKKIAGVWRLLRKLFFFPNNRVIPS